MSSEAQNLMNEYLAQLEVELASLESSDRAEIVLSVRAQLQEKLQGTADLESAFQQFGRVEDCARREAQSRGLTLKKVKAKSSPLKWILGGGLGLFLLPFILLFAALWYFSPIVDVDEESGRVQILGGLIDINSADGSFKLGESEVQFDSENRRFRGQTNIDDFAELDVLFSTARLEIHPSRDHLVRFSCQLPEQGGAQPNLMKQNNGVLLNLSATLAADCEIEVPGSRSVLLRGQNANIIVNSPEYDLNVALDRGRVELNVFPETNYIFDLEVENGVVSPSNLESVEGVDSRSVQVRLGEGQIEVNTK